MRPACETDSGVISGRGLNHPGVDDLIPIDPNADSVVGRGRERGTARSKVEAPGPADRKVVDPDSVAGATRPPIVVNARLTCSEGRATAQTDVVEVLCDELPRRTR